MRRAILFLLLSLFLPLACSPPDDPIHPLPEDTYVGRLIPSTANSFPSFSPCSHPSERWYLTSKASSPPDSAFAPSPDVTGLDTLQAYTLARDSVFSTVASLQSDREVHTFPNYSFPRTSDAPLRVIRDVVSTPLDSLSQPMTVSLTGYASNYSSMGPPPSFNRLFVVEETSVSHSSCSWFYRMIPYYNPSLPDPFTFQLQ